MLPDYLLPHSVQPVGSVESVDPYGNPVQVPGTPGAAVPAYVQPEDTSEDTSDGQVRESRYRVYLNPDSTSALDAWSHVIWGGRRYELVGDPQPYDTPDGTHHRVLHVRRAGA